VSLQQIEAVMDEAVARWVATDFGRSARSVLQTVRLRVADLPGAMLGESSPSAISIDVNGAGYGWFVDASPNDDREFLRRDTHLTAHPDADAMSRMDLLTVVMHELGHILGLEHSDGPDSLMSSHLPAGARRLIAVDAVFAGDIGKR
jgi:hypothetical protein